MPKITAKEVEARKEPGRLACGDNLYLEVDARSLEKRWIYRYQFQGKRTSLGLGSYDAKTNGLAQARKSALEKNALIANGVDPKAHKDAQKKALEASRQADKKAKERWPPTALKSSLGSGFRRTNTSGRTANTPTRTLRRWRTMSFQS